MIAICIVTYNQEQYIRQSIESVQMQQCDEPIRIYIGDDASTDKTQTICETYAAHDKRIIYIRREKNIGLTKNTIELYRRILADGCEYIAMLDGDDFWINPNKLQLQINYLQTHPGVGFVHTNGQTSTHSNKWTFGQRLGTYGLDSVGFANCTVLFKTDLLSESLLQNIEAQNFLWLDYPLYGVFYQLTQWAYLPQITAVWREHNSVSQPQKPQDILQLKEERCRMWKWLDEQYPGKVGYSEEEVQNFLFSTKLNLIYQYDDLSIVSPELLSAYKPRSWKQKIKLIGLKYPFMYAFYKKLHKKFA